MKINTIFLKSICDQIEEIVNILYNRYNDDRLNYKLIFSQICTRFCIDISKNIHYGWYG